jgi:hypothetical protein
LPANVLPTQAVDGWVSMRPTLMMSALMLLATAPLAGASCHGCVDDAMEDCTSSDTAACQDSAEYLANHGPGHIVEIATDPETFVCDDSEGPEMDCPGAGTP